MAYRREEQYHPSDWHQRLCNIVYGTVSDKAATAYNNAELLREHVVKNRHMTSDCIERALRTITHLEMLGNEYSA